MAVITVAAGGMAVVVGMAVTAEKFCARSKRW
jgi:hypothetical protein